MRRRLSTIGALAAAAPLAVSAPPDHATEVRVAAGTGSYAVITRGCDNSVIAKHQAHFDNWSAEASHKFSSSPVRLGVRGGSFQIGELDQSGYVNPYLSLDWRRFSIGGGWVGADGPIPDGDNDELTNQGNGSTASGHVRIGSSRLYFSLSAFEGFPFLSPGHLAMGVGKGGERVHGWLGTSFAPYDQPGVLAQVDVSAGRHFRVIGLGRLGSSEGVDENAFALGLSYRWPARGRPSDESRPTESSPPPPAPASPDSAGPR